MRSSEPSRVSSALPSRIASGATEPAYSRSTGRGWASACPRIRRSGPDTPSDPPERFWAPLGDAGVRTISGTSRFGDPDAGSRGLMKDRG